MAKVFLLYLLCAITDCPPPVLREMRGIPWNLIPSSSEDSRLSRSPSESLPEYPKVLTSIGAIQGRFMMSRAHRKFAAFEGIPFALPPVGELRFGDPVSVKNVPFKGGSLVANTTRKDCLQFDFTRQLRVRGEEDCLYLNVYAPVQVLPNLPSLPVIIWVHGGAFMSGAGTLYGPRYLLDKDIILVTFDYRLGVLGFLSTGDASSRGNYQLKDQLSAFSWVVEHISSFGGDPSKITLMGESSGAMSIALHLISPLSSSKLPRLSGAVLMSGSSFNYASIINDTIPNTKLLAKRLNCPANPSKHLVDCMRNRDPYLVVGQTYHLWKIPIIFRLLFGPVIEENHPEAFLIQSPEATYQSNGTLLQNMDIPVIAGVNKDEGALFTAITYLVPFLFNAINSHWADYMGYMLQYDNIIGVDVHEISRKIAKFYFGGEMRWTSDNLEEIIKLSGDRGITTGIYQFLKRHSQLAPVYGYKFSYKSNTSFLNFGGLTGKDWEGVTHGDELPLIFNVDVFFDDVRSRDDLQVSKFLVDALYNFAVEGRPLPENNKVIWNPVNYLNSEIEVLEIDKERRTIPFPYLERMKFWEDLGI